MPKKYLSVDLDDIRIKDLADVISNKTCKKIIDYISEKEASETEIARDLKLPANTVNYNVKKLMKAGLIEKSKTYFWSVKGKKIPYYKIANKKIIISPIAKKKILPVIGAVIVAGIVATGLRFYQVRKLVSYSEQTKDVGAIDAGLGASADFAMEASSDAAVTASQLPIPEIAFWFFIGALVGLAAYFILSKIKWFR